MTGVDVGGAVIARAATARDAEALAALHIGRITEGFLPTLGARFLLRLYRRIARSPDACAVVAAGGGEVLAFTAGAADVKRLYRDFLLRDGVVAATGAAPQLARSWRRAVETLRYPDETGELPAAEILAVATAEHATNRGLGALTVRAVSEELARRGVPAVKVTVGADNEAALAMYRACGFREAARVHVHAGTASEVLVWTAH